MQYAADTPGDEKSALSEENAKIVGKITHRRQGHGFIDSRTGRAFQELTAETLDRPGRSRGVHLDRPVGPVAHGPVQA
jgi:hypothetical protein